MNRRTPRAHGPSAGFSFVELLVTIVIAGIAFAALVPLFVEVQRRDSGDNARNVALQVAQDKIEKVRQLDYDQITDGESGTRQRAGGQFGSYWDSAAEERRPSATRSSTTSAGAVKGGPRHRAVQDGRGRRSPGSRLRRPSRPPCCRRSSTGSMPCPRSCRTPWARPASSIRICLTRRRSSPRPSSSTSRISPEDIASMDATAADPADRGWVKFSVTAFSGVVVATQEVNTTYNGEPGHYQFIWDNSTAQDGVYKIEMTAVSAQRMQGSTTTMSYNVELRVPPAPTGLTAFPGDELVSLSWDQSAIGDFSHYELWRGSVERRHQVTACAQPHLRELLGHGRGQRHHLLLPGPGRRPGREQERALGRGERDA